MKTHKIWPPKLKKEAFTNKSFGHGYQRGCEETLKACGGCRKCWGKGYATVIQYARGSGESDMGQGHIRVNYQLPIMRFCSCERGKQLKSLLNKKVGGVGITDSAELYDPIAGTFEPTDSLNTSRSSTTATTLLDGRVMKINIWDKVTAYESPVLNTLLGIIGLVMVWKITHNWHAVLWAGIAALHIRLRFKPPADTDL